MSRHVEIIALQELQKKWDAILIECMNDLQIDPTNMKIGSPQISYPYVVGQPFGDLQLAVASQSFWQYGSYEVLFFLKGEQIYFYVSYNVFHDKRDMVNDNLHQKEYFAANLVLYRWPNKQESPQLYQEWVKTTSSVLAVFPPSRSKKTQEEMCKPWSHFSARTFGDVFEDF